MYSAAEDVESPPRPSFPRGCGGPANPQGESITPRRINRIGGAQVVVVRAAPNTAPQCGRLRNAATALGQ
eukprot:13562108-Alexandrium_andersonii.AAC.1